MARTLDQILADLNPGYDPQRASIQTQQDALPGQFDAQNAGLKAQADQANQDILSGAQARGLGFSGIPVGEQAKYNATTFMPAVANLKSNQITAQTSLSDQLAKLNGDERTQAMGVQQQELTRDEQIRQFNQQLAAQKAAASAGGISFGGGGTGATAPGAAPAAAKVVRTANGGFNFLDASGRPINAAQYASGMGIEYRGLLQQMANAGDANAKIALNYVGNDARFGSAPSQYAGALGALGATGSFAKAPTPAKPGINSSNAYGIGQSIAQQYIKQAGG